MKLKKLVSVGLCFLMILSIKNVSFANEIKEKKYVTLEQRNQLLLNYLSKNTDKVV